MPEKSLDAAIGKLCWLHLSDIHFWRKNDWRDDTARRKLIAFLKAGFENGTLARPNLVFCTGDIAMGETAPNELALQYESAQAFFDQVLAVCGLPRTALFVVPGNHDVNRSVVSRLLQKGLRQASLNEIKKDWAGQTVEYRDAIKRLDEYGQFVKKYLPHQLDDQGRQCYAKVVHINGMRIGIAGFNSAWTCYDDADKSQLWLAGEWQFNAADTAFDGKTDLCIGLMHHPVSWLTVQEESLAKKRIRAGFQFWLHGHEHDAWVVPTDREIVICAGAVNAHSDDEFGINLVQLDLAAGSGKVSLFAYKTAGNAWLICPSEDAPLAVRSIKYAKVTATAAVKQANPPAVLPGVGNVNYTSAAALPAAGPTPTLGASMANVAQDGQFDVFLSLAPVQSVALPVSKKGNTAILHNAAPIIVLVTVNDHETAAVLDAFLGEAQVPPQVTKNGVTYFDLGLQGGHRILHTVCEMGAGGIGASQQRTRDAIDHWQPKAIIAVGIAFGIDETKQAIGDVLVSTQIQDYELGRLNNDGTLTPRGDKPGSADKLRNRLRQLNIARGRGKDWPKVRLGLLLCGQKLVDNLDYRESLKKLFPEAIGGEMEGSGVYASASAKNVDWIIVKAICDWGHDKGHAKKAEWQKHAAKNAALVVKAALGDGGLYVDGVHESGAGSSVVGHVGNTTQAAQDHAIPNQPASGDAITQSPKLPEDNAAQRITQTRKVIFAWLRQDKFPTALDLTFDDEGMPQLLADIFNAVTPASTRASVADQCLVAISQLAKVCMAQLQKLPDTASTISADTRVALRAAFINAMQQAILLAAHEDKLKAVRLQAADHANSAQALDVNLWLSVSVLTRDELAEHVRADFPPGKLTVFQDKHHVNLFDEIELGTSEAAAAARKDLSTMTKADRQGAETQVCKVVWNKLFPGEAPYSSTQFDILQGELRELEDSKKHLLVIMEPQHGELSREFVTWLNQQMHVRLIKISTKQGVFDLSEGTWRAKLATLYKTLQPLEPTNRAAA